MAFCCVPPYLLEKKLCPTCDSKQTLRTSGICYPCERDYLQGPPDKCGQCEANPIYRQQLCEPCWNALIKMRGANLQDEYNHLMKGMSGAMINVIVRTKHKMAAKLAAAEQARMQAELQVKELQCKLEANIQAESVDPKLTEQRVKQTSGEEER